MDFYLLKTVMSILFQVLRWAFYFMTFLLGSFLLRGELLLGADIFSKVKIVFMPGYLLFCGVMVGYVIALIWSGKDTTAWADQLKEEILKKSFIIGIVVGLILAMSYIFI